MYPQRRRKCVRLESVANLEVTVRTNWQFWKLWYFNSYVHILPLGISCAIMVAFVFFSPVLFIHWLTAFGVAYLFLSCCLHNLVALVCQEMVLYYSAFTFLYLIPLHNGSHQHAHRYTDFQHNRRSSTLLLDQHFLPSFFYGSSIRILISISCSHFPWSVFIIIEQEENACYGSFFGIRSKSS